MGKRDLYQCDRCKDEFTVPYGEKAPTLTRTDLGEEQGPVLCEDCMATFVWFLQYVKEFNELANELMSKREA